MTTEVGEFRQEIAALLDSDIDRLSKRTLKNVIRSQESLIRKLMVELFCADPYHEYFKGFSEQALTPLRLERIGRLSGDIRKG